MKSNKNKVIQLSPNEGDKNHEFYKGEGNSRETPDSFLFKQTIELKVDCVHGKENVLKSILEVSTKH